jgi:hypothetical protein
VRTRRSVGEAYRYIGHMTIAAVLALALSGPVAKPGLVSDMSWMAGEWKSSASEYTLAGQPGGELDKKAMVLMGNSNQTLTIQISSSTEKGKPYEPAELLVLHSSADGKTTRAYSIVDLSDEPVKLDLKWDGTTLRLGNPSIPISTKELGFKSYGDKIVIEKKSKDRWIYSTEVSYPGVVIKQKLTFDRV